MVHFIFGTFLLVGGALAFKEGIVSTEVMAISLFFSAYAVCMAYLFRS